MKESDSPQGQLCHSTVMERSSRILRLAGKILPPLLAESLLAKLIDAVLSYLSSLL